MKLAEMIDAAERIVDELDTWTSRCPVRQETGVWTCLDKREPAHQCSACRASRLAAETLQELKQIDDPRITPDEGLALTQKIANARMRTYKDLLTKHDGNITETAAELGVARETVSRTVEHLGLRAWLNERWPHRDPATKGRKGERRKTVVEKKA